MKEKLMLFVLSVVSFILIVLGMHNQIKYITNKDKQDKQDLIRIHSLGIKYGYKCNEYGLTEDECKEYFKMLWTNKEIKK